MEVHFVVQFVLGIHMSCKMNYLIHYVQFLHSYTCYKIHLSTLTSMLHKNSVYCILQSSLNISNIHIINIMLRISIAPGGCMWGCDVDGHCLCGGCVTKSRRGARRTQLRARQSPERNWRLGKKTACATRGDVRPAAARGDEGGRSSGTQHTVAPSSRVPAQPSPAQPSCQDTGYYE